jgi:hypothetical protein
MRIIDMKDFQLAGLCRRERQTDCHGDHEATTPKRPAKLGSYFLIGFVHNLKSPVHEKITANYLHIVTRESRTDTKRACRYGHYRQ